jgi:hypothetical protein
MAIFTKDSFVDTTGTNLESHTPSGTGATGSWTRVGGAADQAKINANALEFAGTTQTLYVGTDNGSANHYVQVVFGGGFVSGSGYFPLVLRATDQDNWIGYRYFSGNNEIYLWNAGSPTNLYSAAGTVNAGDTIYFEADGNNLTLKVNGTTVAGPISNSTFNTVTKSGLVTRSATATDVLRSWESGTIYTYARPSSDITTQWTPSTGTSHFAMIDEVTASDADYISATAAGQTDEVKLQAMVAPQAGTSVTIGYRVQGITGSAGVTVSMVQGTTVIAADTTRTANGDYVLTVASGTWASVTDWTDIRLRFVSS